MANGQSPVSNPFPLPGFDQASLLASGTGQSPIPMQLPPPPSIFTSAAGQLFDVPPGGIFDRRLPAGAIPGLGPLAPEQAKVGLFNKTGGRIQAVGREMLETAEVLTRATGVKWTSEMQDKAEEILQGPGGIEAIMQMVEGEVANSPEALAALKAQAQERAADRARVLEERATADRLQVRDDQQFKRYGGMSIPEHNKLTLAYAESQGGIDALDDMIFMNETKKKGGAGIGLARMPSFGSEAQGRIRGAYRSREARLFNVVQKLIQAGVLTPGEIPQIEKFVTSFTSVTADWSQGERDVRLKALRDWIVDKTQDLQRIIPGQNPFNLDFSGQRDMNDLPDILGLPSIPDGFLLGGDTVSPFSQSEQQQIGSGLEAIREQAIPIF